MRSMTARIFAVLYESIMCVEDCCHDVNIGRKQFCLTQIRRRPKTPHVAHSVSARAFWGSSVAENAAHVFSLQLTIVASRPETDAMTIYRMSVCRILAFSYRHIANSVLEPSLTTVGQLRLRRLVHGPCLFPMQAIVLLV